MATPLLSGPPKRLVLKFTRKPVASLARRIARFKTLATLSGISWLLYKINDDLSTYENLEMQPREHCCKSSKLQRLRWPAQATERVLDAVFVLPPIDAAEDHHRRAVAEKSSGNSTDSSDVGVVGFDRVAESVVKDLDHFDIQIAGQLAMVQAAQQHTQNAALVVTHEAKLDPSSQVFQDKLTHDIENLVNEAFHGTDLAVANACINLLRYVTADGDDGLVPVTLLLPYMYLHRAQKDGVARGIGRLPSYPPRGFKARWYHLSIRSVFGRSKERRHQRRLKEAASHYRVFTVKMCRAHLLQHGRYWIYLTLLFREAVPGMILGTIAAL